MYRRKKVLRYHLKKTFNLKNISILVLHNLGISKNFLREQRKGLMLCSFKRREVETTDKDFIKRVKSHP